MLSNTAVGIVRQTPNTKLASAAPGTSCMGTGSRYLSSANKLSDPGTVQLWTTSFVPLVSMAMISEAYTSYINPTSGRNIARQLVQSRQTTTTNHLIVVRTEPITTAKQYDNHANQAYRINHFGFKDHLRRVATIGGEFSPATTAQLTANHGRLESHD